MADRLSLPAVSGGQMRMDYGQQTVRAQAMANSGNGTNYSPSFSSEFSALAKGMNYAGMGLKAGAGIQNRINTDNLTRSQKSALSKYNASAQKAGEAQKNLSGLRDKMADLTGELNALAKAGCDYADQMKDKQKELSDTQAKADKASKDLSSAQAQQKLANQKLKNASTPSPPMGSPQQQRDARQQQRNEMVNANKAVTASDLGISQAEFDLGVAQNNLAGVQQAHNSLLPMMEDNRNQIVDGIAQGNNINVQSAEQFANQTNAYNGMGSAMGEMQQAGKDYLNDVKNTQMFDYAGGQMQGWSKVIDSFAVGRAYEGGAQAMNQTLSTLSNFSSWTGTGMIMPFIQQAVMSAGQTLQNGGNEVDYGMSLGQGTIGLSHWMDGAQRVENAIEYFNADDPFYGSVEILGAIKPFSEGIGRVYGTGTALGAGSFSGLTPLGVMAIDIFAEGVQTIGADALTMDSIAGAGGNFGGQLALGITSPFNAIAQGFGAVFDKLAGTNLVESMTNLRNDFAIEASGLPLVDLTGGGIMINDPVNPSPFMPPSDPNNPSSMTSMANPSKSSSRTKSNCPPKKDPYDDYAGDDAYAGDETDES